MRHPVMQNSFERLFTKIVLSRMPSIPTMLLNPLPSYIRHLYTSSDITSKSCFFAISANASIFSQGITFPEGFDGVFMMMAFVLLVIAASTSAMPKPNFSPRGLSTTTGRA